VQKVTNLKEVHISGDYSDQGKSFWITDSGESFCYGYDSRNSMLNPHAGTNWTGEDGNYHPFHWVTPAGARVKTMHITTDDQGGSEYAGGYRYTDEHGKIFYWGRNYWLSGHNWWTHGWTSTNGQAYNQGHGR